jgi:ferrochelatase
MAYGTPATPADVEAFYTHIRRGNAPTAEQLAELTARYDAIGGVSPLAERTEAQRLALQRALDTAGPGRWVARLGQKHAAPFVEDAVTELADDGVDVVVGVVLAPHFSAFSVGQYHQRAVATAAEVGVTYRAIDRWFDLAPFVDHQARSLSTLLAASPPSTKVLFTAHSLPERLLASDPYPQELADGAAMIASTAGLDRWADWGIAWQSAGRTPEPWRGPDILEVIADLADTGRSDGVVVVPHGFTSDHLEVVYDLDIEAAGLARQHGLAFARTEVVNDDDAVMSALAERAATAARLTSPS